MRYFCCAASAATINFCIVDPQAERNQQELEPQNLQALESRQLSIFPCSRFLTASLGAAFLLHLYARSYELDAASERLERLQFRLSRLSVKYDRGACTYDVSD